MKKPKLNPRWQADADAWNLIDGNRTVARIIPNSSLELPEYCRLDHGWLSLIDRHLIGSDPLNDPLTAWHAVDFDTAELAKQVMLQWYLYFQRGILYDPKQHPPIQLQALEPVMKMTR